MKYVTVFVSFLVVCTSATSVQWKDCGQGNGKILSLDVNPCTEYPCKLHHNTNVSMTVKFTSNVDVSTTTTSVHGIVLGIAVPFPLPQPNSCTAGNVICPIVKGTEYTYHNVLEVLPIYPKLRVPVKWELKDGNGNDLFCFLIPVEISD